MKRALILILVALQLIEPMVCDSTEPVNLKAMNTVGMRNLQEDGDPPPQGDDPNGSKEVKVEQDPSKEKYGEFIGKRYERKFDMTSQKDNCMMCLVENEVFKNQWFQNTENKQWYMQPAADIKKKPISVFCTLRDFYKSKCCKAQYGDDGKLNFIGEFADKATCNEGHCSWHENSMIGTKDQITNENVHQMYTMCMMIEDKRLKEDREFDMVSKLREEKEGDDYDEDARMTEASVNYQQTYFSGQGVIDDVTQICGPMENVTFHIRETNKMSLEMGQDTELFKKSASANIDEELAADTTGNMGEQPAKEENDDTPAENRNDVTPDENTPDTPPAEDADPAPNADSNPPASDPNPPAPDTPPANPDDPPAGGATRRLQGMPGGGIQGPKAGDQAVKTKTEDPPPASDPPQGPPVNTASPPADPPAPAADTTPATVYDNSYVYAPYDKIKMCAMSFERCGGAQCELDKENNIYELRLKQFIDKNKHRFYVVDKYHKMEDGSTGFNIMEITVINGQPEWSHLEQLEMRFNFNDFPIDNLWFLAIIDTSNGAVNTQIEWGAQKWLDYDKSKDIRRQVALVSFLTAFVAALGGVIAVQLLYNQLVVKYCQKDENADKKQQAYDQEAAVAIDPDDIEDNQEEQLIEQEGEEQEEEHHDDGEILSGEEEQKQQIQQEGGELIEVSQTLNNLE